MKIGYACICLEEPSVNMCTCIMRFATEDRLCDIIEHNLQSLKNILIYNERQHIQMFRISSDLIPFGSSPVNQVNWQKRYHLQFQELGRYIKSHGLRVSMHPGQYTLLNSPREDVVHRSILDLQYHCAVLDAMELDSTHKLILHIGGVYGDKESAIQRFLTVYQQLPASIKKRLVIENDDHYYNLEEVWQISCQTGIPVVFDNLHHQILPSCANYSMREWMDRIAATWRITDGVPKIHYSEQAPNKRIGAHADAICITAFESFLNQLSDLNADIMLEVKDKNLSAGKAVQLLYGTEASKLEMWNRYQYLIFAHSPFAYRKIAETVREDTSRAFIQKIEHALTYPLTDTNRKLVFILLTNALRDCLNENEYKQIQKAVRQYDLHVYSSDRVLKLFYRLAMLHEQQEITQSYLFLHLR